MFFHSLALGATAAALLVLGGCGTVRTPSPNGRAPVPGVFTLSDEQAHDIAIHALGLVGTPYRYGGNTPDTGFDCSGLIGYVYRLRVGTPPRTVAQLSDWGQAVDVDELRTGDLVVFGGAATPRTQAFMWERGVLCTRPAVAARCAWTSCSRATGRARTLPFAGPEPSTAACKPSARQSGDHDPRPPPARMPSTHDTTRIDDTRIKAVRPLITPPHCCRNGCHAGRRPGAGGRQPRRHSRVLHGRDDRLVVVVGPCSIHDHDQAMDYARQLKVQADALQDDLLVVMRVYFEKPRTTVGWKGYINDPHLDGSFAINEGLEMARTLLLDILALGLPVGTEFLDLLSPQFISDLVSWGPPLARAPPRARATASSPAA